ncbi:coiled-coil domain-containing protein 187 isoform X2 [Suricata suricatta]|uniref:coiled-coil domain-containing protein 187 isoform X2 n=1 Tax=Suricata suricatta TaxID=37032 RepID=UPI0011552F3F|nr:coiled-coil domain-containing protein 187 isoform X2 [Suricata suricatta]
MAALRWTWPSRPPGDLRGAPHVAWSHYVEQPGPQGRACSLPVWSEGEETKDGDSSVSSGRLSGSSGGHESCTSLPGPWKERPPQVQGPRRTPRETNPRLELLRDKIRAQAWWQASCASLGTSAPSSASRLCSASKPEPRRRAGKLAHPDLAPWDVLGPGASVTGLGALSEAPCGRKDKAILGRGREPSRAPQRQAAALREKSKRRKSSPCKRERSPGPPTPTARRAAKGKRDSRKIGAAQSPPARPGSPSPASVLGGLQVSAHMPSLSSCEQPVNIQNAMAVLRDLRRQIQAGLELARSHRRRGGPELGRPLLGLQDLAGRRRPQGPWSTPHIPGSFSESPQEWKRSSLERPGSFPMGRRWSTLAGWESYSQMPWAAQGQKPSFQKLGSPPERLTSLPQRPWSASAGQASRPRRTWAPHEDWESPARRPWSPSAPRSRSASFTHSAGTPSKGTGSLLPPSELKHGWLRPALRDPGIAPGKENEVRVPPPCPKPRGARGHPHSSESLREFMRQKTLARRRQALEEKASAVRALELRNQRLQDVYRKQREAVLGKAVPVVSHTTPGIVTFFPHCAQSKGLEAPGSLGSPVLEWSKVTSGKVLGGQEAPGSFCLCLNRTLNRTETLETGGPRDGAPVLTSARSSLGPLKLQDLATQHPCPGVCIYLDPEESEHLGMSGPPHFRYKQARLQALETMANILKQRIDILTAKLYKSEALDTLGDPVPGLSPSHPSSMAAAPMPTTPICSGALVPNRGRGPPRGWADTQARPLLSPTCFLDSQTLPWSPDWERWQRVTPGAHHDSQPRGFMEDGYLELDNRPARNTDSFQALRPFLGSSPGVTAVLDPTCGSLRLEEVPSARGASLVTPWTLRSCGKGEPAPRPWAGWSGAWGAPLGTPSTARGSGEALRV